VFPRDPPGSLQSGNIEPCCISLFHAQAGTCAAREGSILAFNASIGHSIGVRFEFVLSFVLHMPFFVFNKIVASFVMFFECFRFLVPPVPGQFRPSSALSGPRALAPDNVSTK